MTGDQCEVILDQIRELNKQMDVLIKHANELVKLNMPRWAAAPEPVPETPTPEQKPTVKPKTKKTR